MDRDDVQHQSDRARGPGSPPILEDDYAQLRTELMRAVARVCPRQLSDRAEDIVQVALMRLMEIRRKNEGKAEFSALYLRKAAYSVVVDEIRRLRRRQEVPLDEDHSEAEHAAEIPDPERQSSGREIGQAIRECLGKMIRPRRLAVTLHLQGHSVGEVARLLGWSPKRADNLVYRGLADLRGCLDAKGIRR